AALSYASSAARGTVADQIECLDKPRPRRSGDFALHDPRPEGHRRGEGTEEGLAPRTPPTISHMLERTVSRPVGGVQVGWSWICEEGCWEYSQVRECQMPDGAPLGRRNWQELSHEAVRHGSEAGAGDRSIQGDKCRGPLVEASLVRARSRSRGARDAAGVGTVPAPCGPRRRTHGAHAPRFPRRRQVDDGTAPVHRVYWLQRVRMGSVATLALPRASWRLWKRSLSVWPTVLEAR